VQFCQNSEAGQPKVPIIGSELAAQYIHERAGSFS